MSARRRAERGAVLLDFFIAVALFMIVLGAFFQMTSMKVRATGEAERRMRALSCAQSKLAEVRAGAAAGDILASGSGGHVAFQSESAPGASGELTVKPRADGLRDVSVVVRWTEPNKGGPVEVALTTVVPAP